VRFWDTSAIAPLLMRENQTAAMLRLYEEDADMFVWWGAPVECVSAIARVEREGGVDALMAADVLDRLHHLSDSWHEIQPVEEVRTLAKRLLRVHPLRAADALQLSAAILAAERTPETMEMVCLDHRLSEAARKEGFVIRAAGEFKV